VPAETPTRLLSARFVLLVASGTGYFAAQGTVFPLLPRYIERELGGGDVAVGVATGVFALGAVVIRPLAGLAGDRFGRRFLVLVGATTYAVSVLLYAPAAEAGGVPLLLLPRILSGLSGGMIYVGQATMATELAPPARQGEAVSYYSVAVFGGLALGPIVGEAALDLSGFVAAFLVAVGFAAASALLALGLPETRRPGPRVHDAAGVPLPRRRLLHPAALRSGSVLFLGGFTAVGFFTFMPLHAEDLGVDEIGPVYTIYAIATMAMRVGGARLPDRLSRHTLGVVALVGTALAGGVLGLWRDPAALYVAPIVLAAGMAFLFPTFVLAGIDAAPPSERASVVGTTTAFNDLANGMGGLLLGVVASLSGYPEAFLVAGALSVAGLVLLELGFVPAMGAARTDPTVGEPQRQS
jgi:MFS family permease